MRLGSLCVLLTAGAVGASGQATSPSLKVRIIAEVETKVMEGGREVTRLAPADRVVPGDEVLYTLEIRNMSHKASDYTHIRWQLRNTLKSHAVAFARFRAVVK